MRIARIVCLFLVFLSTVVLAEQGSARGLLESGMNAYLTGDAVAAMQTLLKNGPHENSNQGVDPLKYWEKSYGKFEGFDIIKEKSLTPRVQIIFFVLNYSKGILLGRFIAYKLGSGQWVTVGFKTDPSSQLTEFLPFQIAF